MQRIQQDHGEPGDLQQSLDAYYYRRLSFDQLRTQWILALAENPEMCGDAVRLLYQQSLTPQLTEAHRLSLKRIVEAAENDGPEDWTVVFDDETEGPSDSEPPPAVTLLPGHVLKNRFVLEEKLGSGGVGIVFRAHDRLLRRAEAGPARIALKVLREEFRTNSDLLKALQREAGHAQGLSHPNIVRVYDFHEDAGTYFLTMELLKGQLLKTVLARLARAPVSRERAIRIITGMCRGLGYAHEHGLVHADFKPGNVILTDGDEPKILDFGLAQAVVPFGQTRGGAARRASTPPLAVTPAYASCNRLEGGPPGFSDDVYSLSCVIYELLSGRHPYNRKSAMAAQAMDLKPSRIEHLTDLQWRTLATGLQLSREHRSTQVHDLQIAFSPLVALRPATAKVDKARGAKRPATSSRPRKATAEGAAATASDGKTTRKSATVMPGPLEHVDRQVKYDRRQRRRALKNAAPILSSLLLGAAMVAGTIYLIEDPRQARPNYMNELRDSDWLKTLRSKIGLADPDSAATDAATPGKKGAARKKTTEAPNARSSKPQTAKRRDQGAAGKTTTDATRPAPKRQQATTRAQPAPVKEKKSAAVVVPKVAAVDPAPGKTPASNKGRSVEERSTDNASVRRPAAAAAGFRLDSSGYVTKEGDAALALQILRQGDLSEPVRVEWTTYEDTAESRLDYVGAFRNVELFAAGESTRTIYIPIVSDNIAESDESFRVALSRPTGNMILVDPFTATVTIVDDDF